MTWVGKSLFQKDIHIFRAIAILFIVGAHTRLVLEWDTNRDTGYFLADFLANSTVLFVFIAGYLFQALVQKFEYRRYMQRKFKNVILPYLIVSIPAVFAAVFYHDPIDDYPLLEGRTVAYIIAWFCVRGGAHINYPLWFILMITLFYFLAPFFLQITRRPALYFLLIPLCLVSVFIHHAPLPHLDTRQLAA